MPRNITVTFDDGSTHVYNNAPDNLTPDMVSARAQKDFGKSVAALDGGRKAAPPAPPQAPIDPTDGMSFGEKALAGAGKAFADTGRGIKQILDIPANALERLVEGKSTSELIDGKHRPTSVVGKLGELLGMPTAQASAAGTQASIDEAKRLDAPLMNTAGGMAGNIAGNVALAALPGAAIARTATIAPKLNAARQALSTIKGGSAVIPAAAGAIQGAIQPVASDESRGENAAYGALGGAVGNAVAKGVGALAKGASEKISPAVKDLAEKAAKHGIDLRADQIMNSKPLNAISAGLDYLPFSGMGKSKGLQQKQFNAAISRTIGQDTDNLVVAAKNAEESLGAKFDDVLKNNHVKADDKFISGLSTIEQDARNELTDAQFGVVQRQIGNLLNKVKQGDVIDADAAYNIKKGLDRLSKSNDTTLSHYASELRGELMEALNRSLPEDVAKGFAQTRQQYRNMIELRKLIPAGAEGDVSAARLANAKTSGPLKELSDISAQFLKQRVGDSGTAPRMAAMGGLLGGGAYLGISPTALATGLTAGRGMTSVLGSDAAKNYLMNGSSKLTKASKLAQLLAPATGAGVAIETNK